MLAHGVACVRVCVSADANALETLATMGTTGFAHSGTTAAWPDTALVLPLPLYPYLPTLFARPQWLVATVT